MEFSDSLELPYVLALLLPGLSLWGPIHQLPEVAWGWPGVCQQSVRASHVPSILTHVLFGFFDFFPSVKWGWPWYLLVSWGRWGPLEEGW